MRSLLEKSEIEIAQRGLCAKYGTTWCAAPGDMKVGVALNINSSTIPVNGLRHPSTRDSTGWYLWAGEGDPLSDPGFFVPLHVEHLAEWRPEVLKFLGLPPGWRFLTDGSHEDVWEDSSLLDIE
jgi:hypothetical protein